VSLYKPGAIDQRQPTWSEQTPDGRWRTYELEDLLARDKISLDLFWLKDDSLLDSDNLPEPDVIASEIAKTCAACWGRWRRCSGIWSRPAHRPEHRSPPP
jgi:type I restriction enzyme M protein